MFNKRKCAKCKYHGNFNGGQIFCYYSALSNDGTCLTLKNKKVVDRRGNDPKNCELFSKGENLKLTRSGGVKC